MHAPISNLNKFLTQFLLVQVIHSLSVNMTNSHTVESGLWHWWRAQPGLQASQGTEASLLRQEQRATNAEVPQLDWRDHGPREPCSSWFLSLLSRFCRCNWQWTWPAAPLGTGTAALDTGQPRHQLDQRVGLSPAWPGAVALPVETALSAVLLQCQGLSRTVHGSTPDLWMERRAQLGQHVSSVAFVNVASLLVDVQRCNEISCTGVDCDECFFGSLALKVFFHTVNCT